MIKLLRGDTSTHLVNINIPDAVLESGAVLEFRCGDMCRAFPAMPRIELKFDAEWTAAQSPGRMLAIWTLVSPEGDRATLTNTYPIYITIDAAEVGTAGSVSAPVVPSVDLSDLEALDPSATPGETKELVNEILRRLRSACIALAIGVPALVSVAATAHKSPLDEVHGTDGVVTNVTFEGLATTADLDDKRDKADLKVYGEVADKTKPYLADDLFPIVCDFGGGMKTFSKDDVRLTDNWIEGWDLRDNTSGSGLAYFGADGVIVDGAEGTYGGKAMSRGSFPRLSFPTSIKPTGDQLATTSTVAQVARSVVNTVWDSELGVAWEARMHNGQLYYVAVTNQPPEVK